MSKYFVGLRNVGSYQVSGHPFVTGSTSLDSGSTAPAWKHEHTVEFPFVAQSVKVRNTKTSGTKKLRVAFETAHPGNASRVLQGRHYIELDPLEEFSMNCKCSKVFLRPGGTYQVKYEVFAELTNIPTGSMYTLTGSGITD